MRRSLFRWAAVAALSTCIIGAAWAADLTGKWTWTIKINDNEITSKASLKQDGEKLTGTVTGRNGNMSEIKEGKIKGPDVSFVVIRERNGQQIRMSYAGKLENEMIKGTISSTFNGEDRKFEWLAKRDKEDK